MKRIATILLLLISHFAISQPCCFNPVIMRHDTMMLMRQSQVFLIEPSVTQYVTVTFKTPEPKIIEDFTLVGSWTKATNTTDPFLNNTCAYSNKPGDQLIVNFYGSKVSVITALAPHHGLVLVQIDNNLVETINLYSAVRKNNVVVFTKDVPFGTHSIKITAGAAGYTVIDYIMINL